MSKRETEAVTFTVKPCGCVDVKPNTLDGTVSGFTLQVVAFWILDQIRHGVPSPAISETAKLLKYSLEGDLEPHTNKTESCFKQKD